MSLFFASTFRPGNNLGLHKENNISDFIDSKFAEANKEDSECAKTSFFISMASIFEKIFDSNKKIEIISQIGEETSVYSFFQKKKLNFAIKIESELEIKTKIESLSKKISLSLKSLIESEFVKRCYIRELKIYNNSIPHYALKFFDVDFLSEDPKDILNILSLNLEELKNLANSIAKIEQGWRDGPVPLADFSLDSQSISSNDFLKYKIKKTAETLNHCLLCKIDGFFL